MDLDETCRVVLALREQERSIKDDRKQAEHRLHLAMQEAGLTTYSFNGQVFRFVQQLTVNNKLY